MPSDFWPEDPLRNNEAHQAWKRRRVMEAGLRQRYVQRGHQLVTCLGCGAVIEFDSAGQHELEWH